MYDVHECRTLDIGFSDRVDQYMLRVSECGFICIYEGS